ncbi:unnamed protein product [Gongylonema pulchrum]|uniref:Uncharacterized protein n=1 Tax=Gongylonema pulchrum TaxID=637853 RepID=A0A183E791_9BILA|nr:unnamed protein product [Gongylonema pulchrum]
MPCLRKRVLDLPIPKVPELGLRSSMVHNGASQRTLSPRNITYCTEGDGGATTTVPESTVLPAKTSNLSMVASESSEEHNDELDTTANLEVVLFRRL